MATNNAINAPLPLTPGNGGTGIANNAASTITISGNFATTFTVTNTTSVTLPTTGTLVNSAVATLSSLASIGTITTGVWNGTVIGSTYGGTGVNNGSNTITLGGNISTAASFTTSGANALTLTTTGSTNVTLPTSGTLATTSQLGSLPYTDVTGTSQSAAVNNSYGTNNAGLVTVTLPTTAVVGSVVQIVGVGAGGWRLAQNASQLINFGSVVTTTGTGGRLDSTNRYDGVTVICIVANTTWAVTSSVGNITYV